MKRVGGKDDGNTLVQMSLHLSGLKVSGSGHSSGNRCMTYAEYKTSVPRDTT